MSDLFAAFGVNWSLLFAQAINFSIVLIALWYFLYKPVMTVLEKRRALVAKGVEEAEQAHALFERADTEAAGRIHAADEKADRIVAAARETGSHEKARILTEAEARAASIEKDAKARAQDELERTRRESEKDIARLAILAAEKVMKKHD